MTDAEIAGIMGWRGPGCYTEAQMRKVRQCIEQAVAAYREDAERLDWLARQFKTSTVYMSGEQPFRPNFKVMGLQGTSFRDAIDAARKGGA